MHSNMLLCNGNSNNAPCGSYKTEKAGFALAFSIVPLGSNQSIITRFSLKLI